jgi:hypothetical protein
VPRCKSWNISVSTLERSSSRSLQGSFVGSVSTSLLCSNLTPRTRNGPEFDRRFQDWTTSIPIPWRNGISPLKDVTSDRWRRPDARTHRLTALIIVSRGTLREDHWAFLCGPKQSCGATRPSRSRIRICLIRERKPRGAPASGDDRDGAFSHRRPSRRADPARAAIPSRAKSPSAVPLDADSCGPRQEVADPIAGKLQPGQRPQSEKRTAAQPLTERRHRNRVRSHRGTSSG